MLYIYQKTTKLQLKNYKTSKSTINRPKFLDRPIIPPTTKHRPLTPHKSKAREAVFYERKLFETIFAKLLRRKSANNIINMKIRQKNPLQTGHEFAPFILSSYLW
jgi:hypothetical protein